jgi:putative protease
MEERLVGEVTHYFGKIDVAGIRLSGDLAVGDEVRIGGHTTGFTCTVGSMQIDHRAVERAGPGDQIGMRVPERVREGDRIFKIA